MELQTGVGSLSTRREIAAVSLAEKVQSLFVRYWANYIPLTKQIKTLKSFSLKSAAAIYMRENELPSQQTQLK